VPNEIRRIRRRLFALAFHGDTDSVLATLAEGFDPSVRDGEGATLTHHLTTLDHVRVLPVLIAAGLSVHERDRQGRTPLHAAASVADTEVMAALVDAGADPDAVDAEGRTPADLLARARRLAQG
jgi:ankyrin repeat protein